MCFKCATQKLSKARDFSCPAEVRDQLLQEVEEFFKETFFAEIKQTKDITDYIQKRLLCNRETSKVIVNLCGQIDHLMFVINNIQDWADNIGRQLNQNFSLIKEILEKNGLYDEEEQIRAEMKKFFDEIKKTRPKEPIHYT
jgi:hypothetical protein